MILMNSFYIGQCEQFHIQYHNINIEKEFHPCSSHNSPQPASRKSFMLETPRCNSI